MLMDRPTKVLQPLRLTLRGYDTHVASWGDPAAPKLFLLHGWMDVGASFQFLVDALERDWHVIAPDLRGYGRTAWQPQGYWFPDYVADLEALVNQLSPDAPVTLIGHSLGGNIVLQYAGVRPQRVAAVVSLEGFGIPAENALDAPEKFAAWLDALAAPIGFAPYQDMDAVAERLRKNNPRLPVDRARFLARHWAEELPDGTARLLSDPRHKLPFPAVYRLEEVYAVWRKISAPVLWVAAADSTLPAWLDDHPEGAGGADNLEGVRRRLAHIPRGRLVTIADAGHMLQQDQPAAVAAAIENFLGSRS
jgi:pimeloyl-ACP methyl ester carboxylesterase